MSLIEQSLSMASSASHFSLIASHFFLFSYSSYAFLASYSLKASFSLISLSSCSAPHSPLCPRSCS